MKVKCLCVIISIVLFSSFLLKLFESGFFGLVPAILSKMHGLELVLLLNFDLAKSLDLGVFGNDLCDQKAEVS